MIALIQSISTLLSIKLVQWCLLGFACILLIAYIWLGVKHSSLKLEHAFLQVEATKQAEAIKTQNKAIKELGDKSKVYLDNYQKSLTAAQVFQKKTVEELKRIGEYTFEGDCSQSVKETLELVKGGIIK